MAVMRKLPVVLLCRRPTALPKTPNQLHSPAVPPRSRGAFRDRHERWVRDAVDVGGAADESADLRTAKPCGPDAPTLASSWRSDPQAMVARKPGHQGERVISRKPLRREGRIVSANLWRLRSCAFFLHARLRVQRAPGFPCALNCFEGDPKRQLGRYPCRENVNPCFRSVMPRFKRGIQ